MARVGAFVSNYFLASCKKAARATLCNVLCLLRTQSGTDSGVERGPAQRRPLESDFVRPAKRNKARDKERTIQILAKSCRRKRLGPPNQLAQVPAQKKRVGIFGPQT